MSQWQAAEVGGESEIPFTEECQLLNVEEMRNLVGVEGTSLS